MKFKRSDHLTKHARKHPNFDMSLLRRPEDQEKRKRELEQIQAVREQNVRKSDLELQNMVAIQHYSDSAETEQ